MKLIRSAALATLLAASSFAAHASAFNCISGTAACGDPATSAITWTWDGSNFTIFNAGSGYVSEVYFDLSGSMQVAFLGAPVSSAGVSFSLGAQPPALPGGNTVGFVSDAGFDSDSSGKGMGIDQGEWATFGISGAALDSFGSDALAAGVHVRSIGADGQSVSLVTGPETSTSVPEPSGYAMVGLGFGLLAWATRRRKT